MPTTQLFVELLVIGIGALAWVILFAAAIFGWRSTGTMPTLNAGQILAGTAATYVLGIIIDRLSRALWNRILFRPSTIDGTLTADAERIICKESERLWNTCIYNRSRLRICRAWTLNAALICLAYLLWNVSVHAHTWATSVGVLTILIALSILAAWATVRLNRDYYNQLKGVFPLVRNCSTELPNEPNEKDSM